MFGKQRKLVVSVEKRDKDAQEAEIEKKNFEAKADYVLHKLEKVGIKIFAGICIYVVLDTMRQVAVAQSVLEPISE